MTGDRTALTIRVSGIVQGVGFRPHVFSLAKRLDLAGDVSNTADGVLIHVEGTAGSVDAFSRDLVEKAPPLSRITHVETEPSPVINAAEFVILESSGADHRATLISPDVTVCKDCVREMFDPKDRRFRYPFINCTNCGPRYTIIDDIPYDRPNTSMRRFPMCDACREEYENPLDRRFHAQPVACPACGPAVSLFDSAKIPIPAIDPVQKAIDLLKEGRILAIKGLGGFHLAVDAAGDAAVTMLRHRKRREEKPFALMAKDLAAVRALAWTSRSETRLLTSRERPIVLLCKREDHPVSRFVAPDNRYFGVMLPYTPLHYLLMEGGFAALVMTSANLSEEPICIDNDDAFERLAEIADYFLVHDRDILLRSDDSIVRRAAGADRQMRRSRGYVPVPVFLKDSHAPVLAVGGALKNTVCLLKGNQAFVGQHVGDLENLRTLEFFELTVRHLSRILDVTPEIIAHDLHPDYLSTRWALEQREKRPEIPLVGVQHHHAHIAACLAENKVDGPAIGLSFDGTGYGSDGAVWGGEVLLADLTGFIRLAHLDYTPMPGAAAAVKGPWRMAAAYLSAAFGGEFLDMDLPFIHAVGRDKTAVAAQMAAKGVNAPPTSSLGRLFDAVAAMVGLRSRVTFEGQAAMQLEMIADVQARGAYDFEWSTDAPKRILVAPIIRGVVKDIADGRTPSEISGRFHATLIRGFTRLCAALMKETGVKEAALSGGSFQNAILLTGLLRALTQIGFTVHTHALVPPNDGGLSLGQAVVAGRRK